MLAAAGAAAATLHPAPVQAQAPDSAAAMRSPQRSLDLLAATSAETPTPEVIALNRMAFGPRPGDLDALMALGSDSVARLQAYVEQQTNPATIDDSACDAMIAAQGFTTLGKSRQQLWLDHVVKQNVTWDERMQPARETLHATFLRAVYSKRQLVEVLADFWHNHFNVYGWDSWSAGTWVYYDRDVVRGNLFGNFRQMLGAVAKSAAMLYYLDNVSNTSAGPNENYARELFELHGLGAENYFGVASIVGPDGKYLHPAPKDASGNPLMYVDEDIYAATQCFTGWRIDQATGEFRFEDAVHAKYSKIVLAQATPSGAGVQDGEFVLDLIANHVGTARYISRKLCRRLISDDPPESVVQAAADVFYSQRNAPDQLKQVVRTILLSPEFSTTWGQKIKRPFEYVVSLLRASNANFAWSDSFRYRYEAMGQALFSWRPPDGYPDRKENWSSTMPMLQRWRMCNWLMDGWKVGGSGEDKDNPRIDCRSQMPAEVTTPIAIVDYWAQRILGRNLPDDERQPLIDFMAAGRKPENSLPADQINDRLRFLVGLIFMAPSFQWR
ncbi:MAG TPA: DUF1800 domain-containing protein [Chloroflexi bacterium]|nr:DUF1800 domain-containing protein [Chloroflexota bacterium]